MITNASSVALGPVRGRLVDAMLVYSPPGKPRPTGLLPPSHELVYMFPRPILPILPSDTSKPRVSAHAIFLIISFPPRYLSATTPRLVITTHH